MHHLFQKMVQLDQNVVTVILITVFYTTEQLFKTSHLFKERGWHLANNLILQVVFVGVFYFVALFQVWSIEKLNSNHLGLFYLVKLPYAVKVILGIACFDLTAYWTHRISHKIPLIWRLHRVHHSDTTMDASTTFRGHPLELTFAITQILAAGLFGLDVNTLTFYLLILLPVMMLEHGNIQFPQWLDKTIGLIFTTPNMHKMHHHKNQRYTDSNFADIFILWDRIFGSFTYLPVQEVSFGLDEFDDKKKQTFWYLLISPFFNIKRITDNKADNG